MVFYIHVYNSDVGIILVLNGIFIYYYIQLIFKKNYNNKIVINYHIVSNIVN